MKPQAILGSAVVALGVATGPLLAPQAASAANTYNFDFSFGSGVTGTITNLVEGINPCNQNPALPGVCVVSVSTVGSATGASTDEPYSFLSFPLLSPGGFTVSQVGGQPSITSALWRGGTASSILSFFFVTAAFGGGPRAILSFDDGGGVPGVGQSSDFGRPVFRLSSTSQPPSTSSVPGPLPVLGAAAAFGWSRKLRKRIKRSPSTGSTAPFA